MSLHALSADAILAPAPAADGKVLPLAPRPASIKGIGVGFLGNLKPNCDVLLKTMQGHMESIGASHTIFREKGSCSLSAPEEIFDEIARTCKAAVVALGD